MKRVFAFIMAVSLCGAPVPVQSQSPAQEPTVENAPGFVIPEEGLNSQIIGNETEKWESPPPPESPLFGSRWSGGKRQVIRGVSMAGILGALALSAGGIGMIFSAAGDGLDTKAMHSGLTIAVSGSLVLSLFSILFEEVSAAAKE